MGVGGGSDFVDQAKTGFLKACKHVKIVLYNFSFFRVGVENQFVKIIQAKLLRLRIWKSNGSEFPYFTVKKKGAGSNG